VVGTEVRRTDDAQHPRGRCPEHVRDQHRLSFLLLRQHHYPGQLTPVGRPSRPAVGDDTVIGALCRWAEDRPDQLAFEIDGAVRATWRELRNQVARRASAFVDRGVGAGEVVGVLGPTGLEVISAVLGLQWIGAIPMVLDPSVSPSTMARRLAGVGCRRVAANGLVPPELPESFEVLHASEVAAVSSPEPPHVAAPERIAFLQASSGSMGEPKASAVSHRSLAHQLDSLWRALGADPHQTSVAWLPLHHDMGLVAFLFLPVHIGRPSHLLQARFGNIRSWLTTIARVGGTFTSAPDFAYRAAAKLGIRPDLSSLRIAVNGGEPVRRSTIEAFEGTFGLGPVVRPGYGLGEATLAVSIARPGGPRSFDDAGVACCGPPLAGLDLAIWADDGIPLPIGGVGEVVVRGGSVFDGYWRDPTATAATVVEGWLRTGDIGRLDGEGNLYVSGRTRAIIKRAGQLIPARAVEEVVDAVEGVRRSAALGITGRSGVEELVVVVECRGDPDNAAALRVSAASAVRTHLGFAPAAVIVGGRRTIPFTSNGKIRYGELRDQLAARSGG
jgi:acyl-CoA synthetase (AMP-forming)/AMP-acid ligase II